MAEWIGEIIARLSASVPLLFLAALTGGVVSSFSPCVLSSVPLVVGYVGGYAGNDRGRAFRCSLVFCLGMALSLTALGAAAALMGRLMSGVGRLWYVALAAIMFVVGLQMLGLIRGGGDSCRLPQGRKGLIGAFIVGVVAGLISSPCATPVLVATLALVAGRANVLLGVGLLAAYSLGHSLLLMIAGTSVGWVQQMASSPATERIGRVAKAVFGAVVILIGGYLLYLGIGR